jgi:hypothetical protein
MGARRYDAQLGRWISADTIIPNPNDPQTLNRYSYVRGNPLKYVDPTGHFIQCKSDGTCYDDGYSVSNPGFTSYEADERRDKLLQYNDSLYQWARSGWITDLEALASLCDYAASMIPTDISGNRTEIFVYDLSSVLTEGTGGLIYQYSGGRIGEVNPRYQKAKHLKQTGFDWVFQDPSTGGEQPHHFWFYVYLTFESKHRIVSAGGNYVHETFLAGGGVGRSYQDFALGNEAVNMGVDLRNGRMEIGDVGNWVRSNLGPGGAAVSTWNGSIGADFEKKFYALSLAIPATLRIAPIPPGQQGGGPAQ